VSAGDVRRGERRFVNAYFGAYMSTGRFVEKTPENSLRIPYVLSLFPDAYIVEMKRNPCDVISSIINGWRHPLGRSRSYYVPEDLSIPDYPHRRRWCFALVDGWRGLASEPVHHIAFAQWEQCVSAIAAARAFVAPSQWVEVYLERLLASPCDVMSRVCASVEVPFDQEVRSRLAELLQEPVNALSPPGNDKWRRDNAREIAELLPRISAVAPKIGYAVDPATGECRVDPHRP
jgi:hypothetical protein